MSIRDTINRPWFGFVVIFSCLAVIGGYWLVIGGKHEPKPGAGVWFYDLNTGQRFVADGKLGCPIDAPSGPAPDGSQAGVRAYVYGCGTCDEMDKQFIAYLENKGKIRSPEQDNWFPIHSEQGQQILEMINSHCGDGVMVKECYPKQ